jgi:uncharacterized protein (DUF427 family)
MHGYDQRQHPLLFVDARTMSELTPESTTQTTPELPDWVKAAREQWQWQGQARPPFAQVPGPEQTSVWDFPRPPRLVQDSREVVVLWGTVAVARTCRAVLVLETAHPPSFYLPWDDVNRPLFQPAAGSSFCEWKGPATYWDLVLGDRRLPKVAWSYPQPLAGAEMLADCVALYPSALECRVDGAAVTPQAGGFYGGWITPDVVGPFKGDAGTQGW